MNLVNEKWLPHLKNEMLVGARDNNLCAYLVALEGWRRGLTLTWYSRKVKRKGIHAPGRVFSLSDGDKTHVFYKTKGDKISSQAIRIGSHKELTKEWLTKANVSVAEGRNFTANESNDSIIEYCSSLGYPVVLKPTNGFQGNGVIANIENEEALIEAIDYVKNQLAMPDVIVERYVTGEEYRFFVIEDEVKAIINRTPANVVGDGVHNIKELIKLKNKERKKNPRLYSCLIKIDYEMERLVDKGRFTFDYIPQKNEQIFLREKSNISTGGDSEDVTDTMPEDVKQVAIDSLKALPNLPHGGVDMIVNLQPDKNTAVVLEINAIPQIGSLVFPMKGKARDIPSDIVDYYFPESKIKSRDNYNDRVFFDYRDVLKPLMSKTASEVKVTPAPLPGTYAKKYIVEGTFKVQSYQRFMRRKALESDLFGNIEYDSNGKMVIIVAGAEASVNSYKGFCERGFSNSTIKNVEEEEYTRSIKVGFEIKPSKKTKVKKEKARKTPAAPKKKLTLLGRIKAKLKRIVKRILK